MKIGIIGCGATGSVFAAYLALGGANDIWMIDLYKEHMDKINAEGLTMETAQQGSFHVDGLHATTNAADVGVCDVLIVVVKSTQTESAMENAKCCIGPDTIVCSLQNGLGNEIPLSKYVTEDRILCGCGRIGTELRAPAYCFARPNIKLTNLFVGAIVPDTKAEAAGRYLVEAFEKGGLRPQYCEDVRPYVWNKAGSNSGFNTVCAILRLKVEEATASPDGMALVDQVFQEIGAVGEAMGIPGLYQKLCDDKPNVIKSLTGYYPSMAQDMLIRHCKTEVDFMTGAISHYGKQVGVPTPTCDVLSQIVRAIEVNYDKQYLG